MAEKEKKVSEVADKKKKPAKEKKEKKTPTYEISYQMYKEGKTIEEIAKERNFTIGTIENHLSRYITTGEISVEEFVPEEFIAPVKELFSAGETLSSIFNTMEGNLSFGQLRMIRATMPELASQSDS